MNLKNLLRASFVPLREGEMAIISCKTSAGKSTNQRFNSGLTFVDPFSVRSRRIPHLQRGGLTAKRSKCHG